MSSNLIVHCQKPNPFATNLSKCSVMKSGCRPIAWTSRDPISSNLVVRCQKPHCHHSLRVQCYEIWRYTVENPIPCILPGSNIIKSGCTLSKTPLPALSWSPKSLNLVVGCWKPITCTFPKSSVIKSCCRLSKIPLAALSLSTILWNLFVGCRKTPLPSLSRVQCHQILLSAVENPIACTFTGCNIIKSGCRLPKTPLPAFS